MRRTRRRAMRVGAVSGAQHLENLLIFFTRLPLSRPIPPSVRLSLVLQGLCLDVAGDPPASGQCQDGVVDGSHLHGQRDGVLVLAVCRTVVLQRSKGRSKNDTIYNICINMLQSKLFLIIKPPTTFPPPHTSPQPSEILHRIKVAMNYV